VKNTLVTSNDGQVDAIVEMVMSAAKNGARAMAEKLSVSGRQRVLAQGGVLARSIVDVLTAKMTELAEQVIGYLKLISGDNKITIAPTDGKSTIASAQDTFPGYIDPDFVNYGVNVASDPTKETLVQVLEMIKDGTFSQIFGGFGENLDRLCLTQNQIISFVQNHFKWLRTDGYGTFFLFKVKNEFFVARVYRRDGRLLVGVHRLGHVSVWGAGCRRRVVVPQL